MTPNHWNYPQQAEEARNREMNESQVDATLEQKLVDAVKCDYCTPAGYMLHHPHCPHSFENMKLWREAELDKFFLNAWQNIKEKILCGESFKEKLRPHFMALCDTVHAHARKSQPGVNEELKKCLWLMLDGTKPDYSDSRSSLSTRQSDINRAWKAYETAESAAPGENLEAEIKTLKYAASICDSKRLSFKNMGYQAACSEIKTVLLASVERLEAGEQMESTATVTDARKTEGAK